jgi:hypothetical protein
LLKISDIRRVTILAILGKMSHQLDPLPMTSPASTTEGIGRFPPLYRWILFCFSIFALKFLLFAIDPVPKLYMGDSDSYIWTALTGWIPPDRSFFYGYVIRWTALWTESLTFLLVVQVCLSAITCILFSSITRVIFELPDRWSYVFGFLCVIDPLQLLYERYVMTEAISLCLYAFVIYNSLLYLKTHRLRNLVIVQAVSVLLIGFRMSFLLQVQINTIILPLIAFAPDILKRIRRRSIADASLTSLARVCAGHLLLSMTLMFLLHGGYKRANGWLSHREPDYLYSTGVTLLAYWAPVLQPEDASDPRLADLIRRGDEFGLKDPALRNHQRFTPGRLIDRLKKLEPDRSKADSLAKKTALHALWRDPLGILGIGWRTYVSYWNVATMKNGAEADFSFWNPPSDELIARLASRFHLSYVKGTTTRSAIQLYYIVAWPYYFLILLAPLFSGLAIALRFVRLYAILLFVHISIMMAMAMTFGSDSIRYFQPISFMTLLVLALGAKIALRSVRKGEVIAGGQSGSVETLRPDLSAPAQSAFTGS